MDSLVVGILSIGRLAAAGCSMLLWLLLSYWQWFVNWPLRGYPSRLVQCLVAAANRPVCWLSWRQVIRQRSPWWIRKPPDGPPQLHHQSSAHVPPPPAGSTRPARKRRQGDWQGQCQQRAARKQRWRAAAGTALDARHFSPAACSARCALLLLLMVTSCITVAAMQPPAGSSHSVPALTHELYSYCNMGQQGISRAAQYMATSNQLTQESVRSCFRSSCPGFF